MVLLLGEENYKKSDYLGIYWQKPDLFRILPGHKLCLIEIKEYIIQKGLEHFGMREQLIGQTVLQKPVSKRSKKETVNTIPADRCQSQDILSEESQLYILIKNWYCKQPNGNIIFKKYLDNPKNRFIEVYIKESENQSLTYSAKISCCLCSTKMTAHKAEYGSNNTLFPRKTRWVCQNFMKHVKEKHLNSGTANNTPSGCQVDWKINEDVHQQVGTTNPPLDPLNHIVQICSRKRTQSRITDLFNKDRDHCLDTNVKRNEVCDKIDNDSLQPPKIKILQNIKVKFPHQKFDSDDENLENNIKPTQYCKNRIVSDEEVGDEIDTESETESQLEYMDETENQGEVNLETM